MEILFRYGFLNRNFRSSSSPSSIKVDPTTACNTTLRLETTLIHNSKKKITRNKNSIKIRKQQIQMSSGMPAEEVLVWNMKNGKYWQQIKKKYVSCVTCYNSPDDNSKQLGRSWKSKEVWWCESTVYRQAAEALTNCRWPNIRPIESGLRNTPLVKAFQMYSSQSIQDLLPPWSQQSMSLNITWLFFRHSSKYLSF